MKPISLFLFALLSLVQLAQADIRPIPISFRSTVAQEVGKTSVSIEYSRPNAKGREIFGALVPFGEVWRTGANQCTSIAFDTPLTIGGTELPAGHYSLFTIPEADSWTIVINSVPDQFGAFSYDESKDVLRFSATPRQFSAPIETFEIVFTDVADNKANIELRWSNTAVSFPISVTDESNHQQMLSEIRRDIIEGNAPTWGNYGEAARYYDNHDLEPELATSWYAKCVELNPDAYWIFVEYAKCLKKLSKTGEAKAVLEAGLASAQRQNNDGGIAWIKGEIANL